MPGLRALIILGAIVAVVLIARRLISLKPAKKQVSDSERDVDKVVACSQCGVHVPEKDLVNKGDRRVCHQCARK